MTTASAPRRFPASSRTKCSIAVPPASSSPSTMSLTLTGSAPRSLSSASIPLRCVYDWPLSSVAPRATKRSPSTVGSNGGLRQSSIGSTGCTS